MSTNNKDVTVDPNDTDGPKRQDMPKIIKEAFEKIRNDEELEPIDKLCIAEFADEFITCSLKDIRTEKIVRLVQMHHHTFTCKKCGPNCWFYYPRFPSLRTIVSVPFNKVKGKTKEEQTEELKKSKEVLGQVQEILEDEEIMEELATIGAVEIEDYKQFQKGICALEDVVKDLKERKQKVITIYDEYQQHLEELRFFFF